MEESKNKSLESLVDSILKQDRLESPSKDFTSKVMQHIEVLQEKKAIVYKPLISKQVWAILGVVLIVVLVYGFYGTDSTSESWIDTINWNILVDNSILNQLGKLNFSNTLLYALVFFGLMLGIQIPILKNYFNQQFKV